VCSSDLVELLFPLIEKLGIRGVGFFDAGNVYEDLEDFSVSDFRTDAGAGIRWSSPFGPLRIEWGYNLDPEPGEDRSRWQFSAGAFF
jgi:outer membrane protein insertion porin family